MFLVASVAGGIDEGRSSPNNGASIAGFVLLLLWIGVAVIQVLRHRRRRQRDAASAEHATEVESDPDVDDVTDSGRL